MTRNPREEQLARVFANPPAEYRPMIQWSWNGRMTPGRIREQLGQFAERGCGGVFVYPRPGYEGDYLSEEWFDLWRVAAEECRRLGLECHIYDEFGWPGGAAGGHTYAMNPRLGAQALRLEQVYAPVPKPPFEVLALWREDGKGGLVRQDDRSLGSASPDKPLIALVLQKVAAKGDGFPFVDLSRRETVEAFIENTYESYKRRASDHFGRECRFAFCDEPQLKSEDGLVFSRHLLTEFHRDHSYDLLHKIEALCFERAETPAVRFDYHHTLNRLFIENFMKPLHDWCEANGLLFTGHLMESVTLNPVHQPSLMAALRYMQAPGTDLLAFQFFPTTREKNAQWHVFQIMIRSVARQLGRRWILCESCGANGYGYDVAQFKPLEDFLLALGVNVLDPHLTHETLSGNRKYEWPQTLGDHSPWWDWYGLHADHTSRVNAALCQGSEAAELLLLCPTTSAWMRRQPAAFRLDGNTDDPLAAFGDELRALTLAVYGSQLDFDFGEEDILAELGGAANGRLTVGQARYRVVVVPATMENWRASTLEIMREYLESGGLVFALGEPPAFVNGRPSKAPAELASRHAKSWRRFGMIEELVAECRRLAPPPITAPDGEALPPQILWRFVKLPNGDRLCFLCNPWAEPVQATVRLSGASLRDMNTRTGEIKPTAFTREGDHVVAALELPPWGHALWLVGDDAIEALPIAKGVFKPVECELVSIERTRPNLLVLDYCDIESKGREARDIATIHADDLGFKWHGLDGTPWRGHQYRRTVCDMKFAADSELVVRWRFQVAADLPEEARTGLRIGIERPWLYEIDLNGRPVAPASGLRWFDEETRAFPVGPLVQAGENVLTLRARPFSVFCEIAPVILTGDFALDASERGFVVGPARPLVMGDWTRQGLPFYHESLRYRFALKTDKPLGTPRLRLGKWAGALASVDLDGVESGAILHPPFALELGSTIPAGGHELVVEVVGNMKNFMGPHFSDGLPGPWSWGACPAHQPAGDKYRFYPVGLFEKPIFEAGF
jgi:hypothetical protein